MHNKLVDSIRLQHIIDAILEIENYITNKSFDDFYSDSMMFNATVRQLEIIGEASNKLSETFLIYHSDIPWAKMIGLRNVLIHNYFGIDDKMIWNIIQINLPVLKKNILQILNK